LGSPSRFPDLRRRYYSKYDPLAQIIARLVGGEAYVVGGGIANSLEEYASRASRMAILATASIFAALIPLFAEFFGSLRASALSALVALGAVLPASIAFSAAAPRIAYSNRGTVLEARFPLLLAYISTLAASGLGVAKIFEELEKRIEEVREFRVEVELANSYIRVGVPVQEALTRVAAVTPSRSLRRLLNSFAGASTAGGDLLQIASAAFDEYTALFSHRVEGYISSVGALMEVFIAVALILPLLAATMVGLLSVAPAGLLTPELVLILTLVVTPTTSAAVLVLADMLTSRVSPWR